MYQRCATPEKLLPDKYIPADSPFICLDCEVAFGLLSKEEKLFVHYLSRAAWEGVFITMFQTSPETPLIFIFLDKVLRLQSSFASLVSRLEETHNFTRTEIHCLFIYAGAFIANCGNYRALGGTKFIPEVPSEKLISLAKEVFPPDEIAFFMQNCIEPMLAYNEQTSPLSSPVGGMTMYWSSNCNEADRKLVTDFLETKQKIEPWNSRVFKTTTNVGKTSKEIYEIRFASQQTTTDPDTTIEHLIGHEIEFRGKWFRFTRGDYSSLMPRIISNLKLASEHTSNNLEQKMIEDFIVHLQTGSIEAHKNGSRLWAKNRNPIVETYTGFVETCRDPAGSRGEFQSFVAIANKEQSTKIADLIKSSQHIVSTMMPWPKEFEKDTFDEPDFIALDVVTFCAKGTPLSINMPTYWEIREKDGYKIVHLQNVSKAHYVAGRLDFLNAEDAELVIRYRKEAFELQVSLHEILGHGSGKLFCKNELGRYNFDSNATYDPLTGGRIVSFYRPGETFTSVFTTMASAYEECRAECVGLYLSTFPEILKVFKYEGPDADNVMYVNWLIIVLAGIKGLEAYNPKQRRWNQPHSQARFVILRVLLEEAKGLLEVKVLSSRDKQRRNLLVSFNRDAIRTIGQKAIGNFLSDLQVYKSTANVTKARKMFMDYSEVRHHSPTGLNFLKIRDVAIEQKKARMILLQSNTKLNETTGDVELMTYNNNMEGFVKSWIDRFHQPEALHEILKSLYVKDMKSFTFT